MHANPISVIFHRVVITIVWVIVENVTIILYSRSKFPYHYDIFILVATRNLDKMNTYILCRYTNDINLTSLKKIFEKN